MCRTTGTTTASEADGEAGYESYDDVGCTGQYLHGHWRRNADRKSLSCTQRVSVAARGPPHCGEWSQGAVDARCEEASEAIARHSVINPVAVMNVLTKGPTVQYPSEEDDHHLVVKQ
jgi:hypothetical protein